jgi:hypothetical protein
MRARLRSLAPILAMLAALTLGSCTTFTIGPAPVPTISSLSPAAVTAGSPAFDLTINGTGFINRFTTVRFGSVDYGPRDAVVGPTGTTMVIRVGAAFVATPGQITVTVVTPTTVGGGGTATAVFTVNSPVPEVTGISTSLQPPNDRNAVPRCGPAFRMTVKGSRFVRGALIRWDGVARTTTFVSATELTTEVDANELTASRTVEVGVLNPAPGGGPSPTTMPFTIYGNYVCLTTTTVVLGILPWFQTRVTFDDPPPSTAIGPLQGLYPRPPSTLPPRLNFPAGQWSWQQETVNGVMVRDAFFTTPAPFPANSRTFSFANGPRILAGLEVITKTAGTLTIRDGNGRTATQALTVGPVQTVNTGWFDQPSATITVEFTAGWEVGITAISYLGLP